jgi:hypothetical protein
MNLRETLAALEAVGSEQKRAIYARHGIRPPVFGVSYAEVEKLRKRIGRDQELALGLWGSGIHDARILATMVADPAKATAAELETWIADCSNYVLTDAVSKLVSETGHARALFPRWISSKEEWRSAAGWNVLGGLISADPSGWSEAELEEWIGRIERDLSGAANRTRYSMVGVLIAIGCVSDRLEKAAIAAARRIGPVEVDHGETGCRTPDAVTYIPKARGYFMAKRAKAAAKAPARAAGPKAAGRTRHRS